MMRRRRMILDGMQRMYAYDTLVYNLFSPPSYIMPIFHQQKVDNITVIYSPYTSLHTLNLFLHNLPHLDYILQNCTKSRSIHFLTLFHSNNIANTHIRSSTLHHYVYIGNFRKNNFQFVFPL